MKFDWRIDIDLRKTATSLHTKPEVALPRRGCHFKNQ